MWLTVFLVLSHFKTAGAFENPLPSFKGSLKQSAKDKDAGWGAVIPGPKQSCPRGMVSKERNFPRLGQSLLYEKLKRLIYVSSKALLTLSFEKGRRHIAPLGLSSLCPRGHKLVLAAFPTGLSMAFPSFPAEVAISN